MPSKETVLGRVQQKDQGEYNESKEYILLDRVTYNDTLYECIKQATNILPSNTAYWVTVGRQGKIGKAPSYNVDDNGLMYIECPDDNTSCGQGVYVKGKDGAGDDIELTDSVDYDGEETKGASSKAVSTVASYSGPIGFITMFYGSFGGTDNRYPIPTGSTEPDTRWVICDGVETNGIKVPDLRGRTTVQSDDQIVYGGFTDYNMDFDGVFRINETVDNYTGSYPYLFTDTFDSDDGTTPYFAYWMISNYTEYNDLPHYSIMKLGAKNTTNTIIDLKQKTHNHNYGLAISNGTLGAAAHTHTITFWPGFVTDWSASSDSSLSYYPDFCELESTNSSTYNYGYRRYPSNSSHTHTLTGTVTVTNNGSDLPPYIALAYIMKIA